MLEITIVSAIDIAFALFTSTSILSRLPKNLEIVGASAEAATGNLENHSRESGLAHGNWRTDVCSVLSLSSPLSHPKKDPRESCGPDPCKNLLADLQESPIKLNRVSLSLKLS